MAIKKPIVIKILSTQFSPSPFQLLRDAEDVHGLEDNGFSNNHSPLSSLSLVAFFWKLLEK